MLLASVIWSTWKTDVKPTAKNCSGFRCHDNVRTCHLLPLQDFSLMVEIWEIYQICPSTAWKPVASETALCLTLFRFWTKPNPFSRTAVCVILTILFLIFSIHSQWVSLSMLAHAHAHTCTLTSVCRFAPVHYCPAHCAPMVDPITIGVEFHQLAYWVGRSVVVGFVYSGVWAGVCAWGCGSMYRVVSLICIFVQLLHLFEYFNVSLLARFISVFLKFNLCDFLNMCNVYLCVIFNIS